jgi:hypothetical protein
MSSSTRGARGSGLPSVHLYGGHSYADSDGWPDDLAAAGDDQLDAFDNTYDNTDLGLGKGRNPPVVSRPRHERHALPRLRRPAVSHSRVRGQFRKQRNWPLIRTDRVGVAGFEPRPLRPELRAERSMEVVSARRGPLVGTLRRCRSTRLLSFAAVCATRRREVERGALVDAAAWWLSEPNGGEERVYALLAASCATEVTTEHAYLALITPPEVSVLRPGSAVGWAA